MFRDFTLTLLATLCLLCTPSKNLLFVYYISFFLTYLFEKDDKLLDSLSILKGVTGFIRIIFLLGGLDLRMLSICIILFIIYFILDYLFKFISFIFIVIDDYIGAGLIGLTSRVLFYFEFPTDDFHLC